MKVFDLHIGLSDSVLQLYKDPSVEGKVGEEFPNQFDFIRAKKGNLDTFCGMICPIELDGHNINLPEDQKSEILKHIEVYKKFEREGLLRVMKKSPKPGAESRELRTEDASDIKAILGLEGVYFIQNETDFEFLDTLIDQGVQIIGLKWNLESKLFKNNRLTSLGKDFLSLCVQKSIILDLAHSEGDLIEDILNNFGGKVFNSHTCLFSVRESRRNIRDEFVTELIKRNALIGINFVGEFVGGNTINDLRKHFEYFIDKFGINNLAIGSDFDGMEDTDLIKDLEDVSKYQSIEVMLKGIGLDEAQISNILFNNAAKFLES